MSGVRQARFRALHRDEINAKRRGARAADPEKHRAIDKAWKAKNPDRLREYQKRYRNKRVQSEQSKARERERKRVWAAKNKDVGDRWREANKAKVLEAHAALRAAHPERYREYTRKAMRKDRENLHDRYIVKLLAKNYTAAAAAVLAQEPILIEAKRAHIKLLRIIKWMET